MTARVALLALLLCAFGCDTAGFREAYMSLDSTGARRREFFYTDTEAIYCIGKLASGVEDLTVSATLRAERIYDADGRPRDVDFYLGTEDDAPGAGEDITVSFLLERDESDAPYPAGDYVCELSLDGELVERLPFEIRFPTCPEAPITDGAACAGFVLADAECAGAFSDRCICGAEGAWECR